jgi:hypothetical protein
MAKDKPPALEIKTYPTHHVITQPNPLRKVLRRIPDKDVDDPVARAEKALAGLSGEFKSWMLIEAERLSAAHAAVPKGIARSFSVPPTTSRAMPRLSAIRQRQPPRKACAGSSSTRQISTRCRPN